jgi:hypothetical protein
MYRSYVIRLYRTGPPGKRGAPRSVAGVVESADDGAQAAFHSPDELWALLTGGARSRKPARRVVGQRVGKGVGRGG